MAGKRQPTDLVVAKGKKHLTKAEEAERRSVEPQVPPAKQVRAPRWLPPELKDDYMDIGHKLIAAGLYTALDADALGRYLVAQHEYLIATNELEKYLSKRDQEGVEKWGRIQERHFKQARNCAGDLGLTVSSRCRLVLPPSAQKPEDDNAFLTLIRGGAQRNA